MNTLVVPEQLRRIAVVDDNLDEVELKQIQLRRAGFDPYHPTPWYGDVARLVEEIASEANAALLDNCLQQGGYSFYGAQAVEGLYERRIPAVLMTQFFDQDYDVSIRQRRRKIPVVLSKEAADPRAIVAGLDICCREYQNDVLAERRPCRTLIRVERVEDEARQRVVDAFVLSWNPHRTVRFPASLLPPEMDDALAVGQYLIAQVNTGAQCPEDLFFFDFEEAPEPLPEEAFGRTGNS